MPDEDSPSADSPSSEQPLSPPTPGAHNTEQSVFALDSVEYGADETVLHATYSSHRTDPSIAVVSALAAVTDTDPMALGPLHDAVDTDALDAILTQGPDDGSDVEVSFTVAGHVVTVHTGGTLTVRPQTATDP